MTDTDIPAPTSAETVDGFSDNAAGTVGTADPGTHAPLQPLSADERAKEEAEIRADGGAEDLKK
jgi:hypothetical protein